MKFFTRPVVSSVFLPGLIASLAGYSQNVIQPAFSAHSASQLTPPSPILKADYGRLPLSFEPNQGQSERKVLFQSRGQGYSFFLTNSGATLALTSSTTKASNLSDRPAHQKNFTPEANKTDIVQMDFPGAARNPSISGEEMLPGKANYFIGKDPSKWHKNVPTYGKVKYKGVYPGIDLVYYGNQQKLEYDFIVAPRADPKPVRLHFAGVDRLKLDDSGDLQIIAKDGQVAFHKPVVYQTIAGKRLLVDGEYIMLAGNNVGFHLGSYNHSQPLVIDPILAYSTFFEGSVAGLAVDNQGNAYLTGVSEYPDKLPVTPGAFETRSAGSYVTKLNPAGSALVYSTYVSGTNGGQPDLGTGIAINPAGEAYITGGTASTDFPSPAALTRPRQPAASSAS